MTLYRFSRAETASFFTYAKIGSRKPVISIKKSKQTIEIHDDPKRVKPDNLSLWKLRSVVRNILPELCDPHNP